MSSKDDKTANNMNNTWKPNMASDNNFKTDKANGIMLI